GTGNSTLYRLVSPRLCVTDEFFETRSTWVRIGSILILGARWEYRRASLTTQPCKRSAVTLAGGACCFWASEPGLDPRWCGTEISCHSSWAISPTRMERSSRTISASPALQCWARENADGKAFMPSCNYNERSLQIMWSWAVASCTGLIDCRRESC